MIGLRVDGDCGDCGGVMDRGSEDTMPSKIADEVIVYGNVLLHENVEPRKPQIFFQLSISTAFAKQVGMPPFHCSVLLLHAPGQGLSSQMLK